MKIKLFITGLIIVLTACNHKEKLSENLGNQSQSINKSTTEGINEETKIKIEKTINLTNGFIVKVGGGENFGTFTTYTFFELVCSDRVIYKDTLREYEFGDKLYPLVLHAGVDKYELLFEVNDRPNKNYLLRLFVQCAKIVKNDTLPTFITTAHDLDGDGLKEYAGYWDYGEVWGENNDSTAYNPILFYKIEPTGLKLDSVLTIKKNKKIYGEFYGFNYNENHPVTIVKSNIFGAEVDRIERLK